MTKKKNVHVAGITMIKSKAKTVKNSAGSVLTQGSRTVTPKSGKVIGRTVTTHRDALQRLANR